MEELLAKCKEDQKIVSFSKSMFGNKLNEFIVMFNEDGIDYVVDDEEVHLLATEEEINFMFGA